MQPEYTRHVDAYDDRSVFIRASADPYQSESIDLEVHSKDRVLAKTNLGGDAIDNLIGALLRAKRVREEAAVAMAAIQAARRDGR